MFERLAYNRTDKSMNARLFLRCLEISKKKYIYIYIRFLLIIYIIYTVYAYKLNKSFFEMKRVEKVQIFITFL